MLRSYLLIIKRLLHLNVKILLSFTYPHAVFCSSVRAILNNPNHTIQGSYINGNFQAVKMTQKHHKSDTIF